jgi:hypothetical protein
MRLYKFILTLILVVVSQFVFSQNFLPKDKALEQIEIKKAALETSFEEGTIPPSKMDIYNYFIEITVIYLKEGNDVPETLAISFEKCLNRFENNQEDVVEVKDDITNLLTIN